jgi:aspartate/methionine/tyrosine aminotransferase
MPFALPFARRTAALLEHVVPIQADAAVAAPAVRAAVEAALDRGETHYTDRPGILPLRQRIAERLSRRFKLDMSARDIVVTCGATEARFAAIQQLLQPEQVLAAPTVAERVVASVLIRRARLASAMGPETRMVYLASSAGPAALDGLPPDAWILFEVDEAASSFHPAHDPARAGKVITIGGLEADSWRIGFLASGGDASAGLRDFKQALTICSTNLSQWAVLAALEAA